MPWARKQVTARVCKNIFEARTTHCPRHTRAAPIPRRMCKRHRPNSQSRMPQECNEQVVRGRTGPSHNSTAGKGPKAVTTDSSVTMRTAPPI